MPKHSSLAIGALICAIPACQPTEFGLLIRPDIDRRSDEAALVGVDLIVAADIEYDCEHCDSVTGREANVEFIEAHDSIDSRIRDGGGIEVRATVEGRSALRVFAPQVERFVIEAKVPTQARIDWDYGWNLDGSEPIGPVFAGTVIPLVQRHYSQASEPLRGVSPYTFDPGSSGAELLAPPEAAPYYYATNSVFVAGEALGEGSISTDTGASLDFSVVDATAVATVAFYDATPSGTTWTETALPRSEIVASSRENLRIVPFTADGQPIAGCPQDVYEIEIEGDAILEPNPYVQALCELALKVRSDATVTVTWGTAKATLEVRQ